MSLVVLYIMVLVGIIALAVIIWGVFDIRLGFFIKTHCHSQNGTDKKIVLTFDDGPTPHTLSLLAVLKRYNAKATFFCIGKQVEQHPEILRKIIAEGHRIGNHTYSHANTIGFWRSGKITNELVRTQELIFRLTNLKIKWFRPPFGITNPHIAKAARTLGYTVVGWNIRSLDTIIQDEKRLLQRIQKRIKPGAVLLMHDTSDKSIRVLEQLLILLQKENYQIAPLDESINSAPYEK
ncbi:MAG: polysaccharide deacetylase family protein [Capnocytophaga sp.]|nr:polysaccharide deacetylase family protein [Capnocytophaga sp.]